MSKIKVNELADTMFLSLIFITNLKFNSSYKHSHKLTFSFIITVESEVT